MTLTAARRAGLQVLADTAREGKPARESNHTSTTARTVYWQTVRWLQDHGYVTVEPVSRRLHLTDTGRALIVTEIAC